MIRLAFLIALLSVTKSVFADQYSLLQNEEFAKVAKLALLDAGYYISYCEPCSKNSAERVLLKPGSVSIRTYKYSGRQSISYQILIDKESIDLAYVYIPFHDVFRNLAHHIGFAPEGVSRYIKFSNHNIALKHYTSSELIYDEADKWGGTAYAFGRSQNPFLNIEYLKLKEVTVNKNGIKLRVFNRDLPIFLGKDCDVIQSVNSGLWGIGSERLYISIQHKLLSLNLENIDVNEYKKCTL